MGIKWKNIYHEPGSVDQVCKHYIVNLGAAIDGLQSQMLELTEMLGIRRCEVCKKLFFLEDSPFRDEPEKATYCFPCYRTSNKSIADAMKQTFDRLYGKPRK